MDTNGRLVAAALGAALLLPACSSIGIENVVFATRTNVAVDLDMSPPTASIGYKRDELVLEPRDEFGRTLPVLTTVSVSPGTFSFGANHSFATGDAAVLMAQYLTSPVDLSSVRDGSISFDMLKQNAEDGKGLPGNKIGNEGRERIVFTTNTSLGLEASWNAESLPDAVSLGYKRKEFAFVPLAKVAPETDANGKVIVDLKESYLVSLLATAHGGSKVGSVDETGAVIGQTFATGLAATLMASHPEVRQALGPAIIPKYDEIMKAKAEMQNARTAHLQQLKLMQSAVDGLLLMPDSDEAKALLERLDTTAFGADEKYRRFQPRATAPYLHQNGLKEPVTVSSGSTPPKLGERFKLTLSYVVDLEVSVGALEKAQAVGKTDLAASGTTTAVPGEPADDSLEKCLERYRKLLSAVGDRVRGNKDVTAAVTLFVNSLTGGAK